MLEGHLIGPNEDLLPNTVEHGYSQFLLFGACVSSLS